MKHDTVCRVGAILTSVLFVAFWIWNPIVSTDATEQMLFRSAVSRLLGSIVFLFILLYLRFHIFKKPAWSNLIAVLPALLVVVNNLPILGLANGWVQVDRSDLVWLFALESLMIGLFEELAFRGVLFVVLLEPRKSTRKGIIRTAIYSSAIFGLIHLVNLLEGAGFGATVLQVGYSFLIGGMCSIVLLKTGNLLYCIFLHGIYDFCGGLIPTLGSGELWDLPTVIFTAVLGVAVCAWMLWLLFHIRPEEVPDFYNQKIQTKENKIEHHSD